MANRVYLVCNVCSPTRDDLTVGGRMILAKVMSDGLWDVVACDDDETSGPGATIGSWTELHHHAECDGCWESRHFRLEYDVTT